MRDDPGVDAGVIAACLETHYGIAAASVRFLPIGYDFTATVYEVTARDGATFFLKIRLGPVQEPGPRVPRALIERGVPNILAPVPARTGELWRPLAEEGGATVVLYPFIRGENAMVAGLSDTQWREFGATLAAVHASGLAASFRDVLPAETFGLPSAALVRRILRLVETTAFADGTAARFAAFWRERAGRIRAVLERAEGLGGTLRGKPFETVLCHADIHAANILAGDDGEIHLIDWDGPLLAPRERDLLFVVGSRIARRVTPREEDLFFAGYGPAAIDRDALVYYRYERIIEDLGELGKSVFLDLGPSEAARAAAAELGMGFFGPDGDVAAAERVARVRFGGGGTAL